MFTNFLKYDWANLVKGFDQAGNFEDPKFQAGWKYGLVWTVQDLLKGNTSALDVPRHGVDMEHVQYMFWLLNLMEFIIGFIRFESMYKILLLKKIEECWKSVHIHELKHEDPLPISHLIQLLQRHQDEMDANPEMNVEFWETADHLLQTLRLNLENELKW